MNRIQRMIGGLVVLTVAMVLLGVYAQGQDLPCFGGKGGADSMRTFYLTNVVGVNEVIEIQNAMRSMVDPNARFYVVPAQNAIVVCGSPDDLKLAQQVLKDLDRPKKAYRLTYTITDIDNGKTVGGLHFSVVVVTGGRTTLKNGSKVPIATGSYDAGNSHGEQTQFTYLDVGLNIDASLDESPSGTRLKSKVERSSIGEETSGLGKQDPVVRQTVLEGTAILTPGKPVMLGSMDVTGSTRHLDVDVVMEAVK